MNLVEPDMGEALIRFGQSYSAPDVHQHRCSVEGFPTENPRHAALCQGRVASEQAR